MATNEILIKFAKDHEQQQTLFNRYDNAQKIEAAGTTDLYNDLRNFMKKHNNRECTLYSEYEYTSSEMTDLIHRANNQGEILLELLEDSLVSETKEETLKNLKKFQELLNRQVILEEKSIYPRIEKQIKENGQPSTIIDDF
jgi:uncharacterized protein (UPF0276 family)